ncbi:cytochrome P450 CYP82D47-like [Impatiens glandulifera]|uniref:cytochrome P450 CYP82D47-like n=1 Tax=Impatiens glandulifera TaxID=253017 RepID=UPI001FB0FD87|nr:cytochrome P450 CYP82D47-like [Impatiens glandulifera]XP_047328899.1 cytochrome P450 CYP82D47-like [Impatiens glandulifera]
MISIDYFSSLDLVSSSIAGSLFILVLMSLYYFLYLGGAGAQHKLNKPPEPSGAWPVLGHLLLLRGPNFFYLALSDMADKYGPIFSIRLGLRRAIVVSNWELAKELSTTHDLAVASRPRMLASEHLGYNYAMFAFSPYGSYWREIRKFVSLELLSMRRVNSFGHIRVSETKSAIQQLYKLWAEKGDDNLSLTNGVTVEMKQWISDLTTNVIFRMIYGKRYSGADVDIEEARKYQRIFKRFSYLFGLNVVGDMIPWLRWLDIGGYEKVMKETSKEYDHLMVKLLEEHNNWRKGHNGPDNVDRDFMDVMISMLKKTDINGYDADTINKSTCSVLNVAGVETTSTMLIWTLCLLMNHRHALKKVEEELDIHVGKERNVEESDIPKLVYLQAVFKESLRLYPPAPLGAPREVIRDCVVDGYHVAAGTRLFLNLWKLHRDPKIWSEPLEFRPERFITTHKNIDVRGQNFELIPFGAGRRVCPGINLGMQMGHLVLASLLHSFQISNINNELVDMTETEGSTISKATPLQLIITPKLSSDLYA